MSPDELVHWKAAYLKRRPNTNDTGLLSNGVAILIGDGEFPDANNAGGYPPDLWERAQQLRFDLQRLRRGWQPTSADLTDAPELTDAVLLIDDCQDLPVLHGLLDRDIVCTDAVAAVDAGNGHWARTVSTWVRLTGAPCLKEGSSIAPAILSRLHR